MLVALLVLLPAVRGFGQEYRGTVTGVVADSEGSVIQNARIVVKSPEHTYNGKSDSKGSFYIPYVQPGTYSIKVDAPGFKSVEHTDVTIDVSAKISENFVMPVGAVSETVSVTENPLELSTADASGGSVIDPDKVQNLPLNGRQVYMLMELTPGVRFTQTQFGPGGYSGTRGWDVSNAYSISGLPGSTNQFLLNGAPISIQGGGPAGTWTVAPSIDGIQEFKIMTITFDAQYGRVGGGAVNIILKNGTPHFHGTAYDFWKNSILDANTFNLNQVNEAKPFHNEHQFGGTLGGPFTRNNKGFFFFSYEGYRQVLPAGVNTTVPTADMYPGPDGSVNLSSYLASQNKAGIYDPNTTTCTDATCANYTRQMFPGNIIPANRISPIGLSIMKLFPAPNRPGYTNNYVFNGKDRYKYNIYTGRADYDFTDRTKLYGIFSWWSGTEYRNGNGLTGPAIMGNINNYRSGITQVLDLTHTFSPRLIGDVRASFNRYWTIAPNGTVSAGIDQLTPGDLGLTMPSIPTSNRNWAPEIDLGDNLPSVIGNSADPNVFETYDIGPSITQVLGNHNLHYGAEWSLYHDVPSGIGRPSGYFSFSDGFTQKDPFVQNNGDGSVVADLLMGYSSGGGVDYNIAPYESYRYTGAFVQDDWKVRRNITVNAGIRWDAEFSPIERHNRLLAGMCFTCINPVSSLVPSLAPMYGEVLFAGPNQPAYPNNTGYWQPKIGISWGPNKNTVIHGGYLITKAFGIELGGASAWNQTTSYNSSPDGGLHPSGAFNSGIPYPNGYVTPPGSSLGGLALVGSNFGIDLRDRKIIHVQEWTVGIQQALPFQMVGEITYLGNHASNLRASKQLDPISATDFALGHANPNYLDQQVPNPFYGAIDPNTSLGQNPTIQAKYLKVPYPQFDGGVYDYTFPGGYSNYDALLAKLEKRFSGTGVLSKGLSFLTSFTWSHLLSATGFLNNNGAGLVDPEPYYTTDGSNRPWDLAFSGLWGLPIGRGGAVFSDAHGLLGQIVNDWQMDWIFQNDGGQPVGYPNGDLFNCGNYNIVATHRSWKSYLNNTQNNCFQTFPEYTAVTQVPISTKVLDPWAQQTAIGFEKKFLIREGVTLQYKAEAFNITNTAIFGGPNTGSPDVAPTRNTSVASDNQPGSWSGYGTIGSTQQNFPRQIQMSLKLQF
ncbi:carboxypeptidase regulatory-like domain-containing protein [Silvibacterium acidisoli]|uniref:carboxypeptidase regulatory-like domain-containing protein n=1 Tax=Acidobacteriaceae bacterium ZG23-2 TaxID=2883246 RepID=UPI00406C90B7